jgi:hypothetical protein
VDLDLTRGVSAIILAAGANTRLRGLVAPFMKPLMLVNGRSLIAHARSLAADWSASQVIAVVAPENARPAISLIHADAWVLQPEPTGIMDALRLALPLAVLHTTLILCADNTFEYDTDNGMNVGGRLHPSWPFFGARVLDDRESLRFTRFSYEPKPRFIERGEVERGSCCWIGPVMCPTNALRAALDPATHATIEEALTSLNLKPFYMLCSDHGVPEEVS